MVTAITEGIKVSVITEFISDHSNASLQHFVFTYRVRIENQSDHTIRLRRRHWFIYDSNGVTREVEGEGVIGQQPILEPGQVHEYVSGSNLQTTMGKMAGSYLMERMYDGREFLVQIPEFLLIVPYKLN
ncbi:Co2+/Mg2+ efflux protein ApaG [Siphonobacter curvatus]|uniref:Co2+/Mg2+ efflux protein ApaG n=1 Tax=Siphonobacter curvatus TaxID=2094562 RepID=A0A2S7IT27_9BACT|nr:Co2+/Mg2+ efflux protein ApaG [Siphonobacter curvatus]PQA60832.1 Co2+/Mg2+ efflux protein ApaG [Siphonobacter curvatus]